jgi:outer membrane protein assembly factor BamA
MTARALLRLAVVPLVLAAGRPLSAQTADPAAPFVGLTVTRVEIEVEGRDESPPELEALVAVRPGLPLRREDWRSTLSRFAARFEQVSVLARLEAGGVGVIFRLEPPHPIDTLEVAGDTGIRAPVLRQIVLNRYGGVPAGERLDDVEAATERLLADQGFWDAEVVARTVETHDPDRATLVLDVAAGPVTRIAAVSVAGQSPLGIDEVIRRAGVLVGDPYRQREVQARMAEIEERLRSQRYYEASARVAPVRRDDGSMDVTLVVDAGPLIVLRVEGDELPGPVEELVPIARSRSADPDLLEDARRRIEAQLRDQGFRDAQAPFTRDVEQDEASVVITYRISRGPRYRVASMVLPEGLSLPAATVRAAVGIEAGQPFSVTRYEAGVGRALFEYAQRGYHEAAGYTDYELRESTGDAGERQVVLLPRIVEGPRAAVASVEFQFTGTSVLPEADLRRVMRLRPGEPYVLSHGLSDVRDLERLYRDRGFRSPAVTISPDLGDGGTEARLTVTINEGPQTIVGDIVVVGNEQVSTSSVRETLALAPGEPFGDAAVIESRRRLYDLGIFRLVSIEAQDLLPGETQASVVVSVEELPATTIGFGGGLEVGRRPRAATPSGETDILEFSPRGFFEVGRRNLGGRNRAVNLFARVALKPRTVSPDDPDPDAGTSRFGFTEYRVTGTFNEQRAFRTDTNVVIGLTSEQGVRTLFNFARQRASAEALRRLTPRTTLSTRYALDFSRLFDVGIAEQDRLAIDRLFPQVRISAFSVGALWDRRDDPVAPSRGTLATADVEVAARGIGSEVGYAKSFFQVSGFRPAGGGGRAVFAGRAQVGMARGFPRVVPLEDAAGNPILDPDGKPRTETVEDLPASQRYFAGGGATVRGFQIDRLGVPEIINANGLSNGGNAVVVLNGEIRAVVLELFGRDLGAVAFLDAGNVFAKAGDVDLTRLRKAVGFGVRYDSPIGPLRLDFGFKTARRLVGGRRERGWEYHFSIGEAF